MYNSSDKKNKMQGLYLINKPVGITSHDVIDRLRRITGERRIGHAGTLDPLASGLMLVAIGKGFTTKLSQYVGLDKEYEAELTLGQTSTTQDREGRLTKVSDVKPSQSTIEKVLRNFIGKQKQVPPMFSAKKIGGRRAYELAREGEEGGLRSYPIEVFKIEVLDYNYPKLKICTKVSSGTYIRSLAYNIGQKLGTGAYLSALIRTKVGEYELARAVVLDEIKSVQDIIKARVDSV